MSDTSQAPTLPPTIALDTRTMIALLKLAAHGATSDAELMWIQRLDADIGKGILAYGEQQRRVTEVQEAGAE